MHVVTRYQSPLSGKYPGYLGFFYAGANADKIRQIILLCYHTLIMGYRYGKFEEPSYTKSKRKY